MNDPSVRAGLAVAQLRLAEVYYELDRNNDAIAAVNAGLDPWNNSSTSIQATSSSFASWEGSGKAHGGLLGRTCAG